jgi:transposase InsO family protein
MDYYHSQGRNARLTCRHFDIAPQTFYRWKRRYDPRRLKSLEDRSRRPRRLRRPTASLELVEAVREVREANPRWGKDKLARLLREAGWQVSNSMVGRIMHRLREQGRLVEAPRARISVRRRSFLRPYAIRKPKGYEVNTPGDLVQVDTLDLRPLPGVILKHFTARDMVSRWDVLEIASRATAVTASRFLNALQERSPYPVRAIQVDGGSEFQAEFERECKRRGILLFVLPPRSPKLNGRVERAHRTHREEFYEVADLTWTVAGIRPQLLAWERIYNTVRPHQALSYKTPWQAVCEHRQRRTA